MQKFRFPVHFASRRLHGPDSSMSPSHLEATAVLWALEYFRNFVLGSRTVVYTDHGPLQWILTTEFKNSTLIRFQARLQEFAPYIEVKYRPGRVHSVPDGLSRLPARLSTDKVDDLDHLVCPEDKYCNMLRANSNRLWVRPLQDTLTDSPYLAKVRRLQRQHPKWGSILNYLEDSPERALGAETLRRESQRAEKFVAQDGLLYRRAKVKFQRDNPALKEVQQLCIPDACKHKILRSLHDHPTAAHIGIEKMLRQVRARFYWPNYEEDIRAWVISCPMCQRF